MSASDRSNIQQQHYLDQAWCGFMLLIPCTVSVSISTTRASPFISPLCKH
jgi:hypothetical protein